MFLGTECRHAMQEIEIADSPPQYRVCYLRIETSGNFYEHVINLSILITLWQIYNFVSKYAKYSVIGGKY